MRKIRKQAIILILTLTLGIFLCSAVSATGLAASPQPKIHHDNNNTGQSQYKGPQTNTTKWSYIFGNNGTSSPVIGSDGTIYFGSKKYDPTDQYNPYGELYAMYPNGKLKWCYNTIGAVRSSPAIGSDGTLYFGTCGDEVYALNPNGTKKWNYSTGSWVESSPAIGSDGTIYLGCMDDNLYAIKSNGTLKWKYKTGDWVESSPAIGSDGTIYFGSLDHNLYALNPNGTLKWKYNNGNWDITSSPVIGKDGTVYLASEDGNLYALNPNGTKKWNYDTGGNLDYSPAIGSDGIIYFAGPDQNNWFGSCLYALNSNGTKKWGYAIDDIFGITTDPTIGSDGSIYFGTYGILYAINHNGTKKWNYTTDDWIFSDPAIGSDGTLYFGIDSGELYALADTKVTAADPTNNAVNVPANKTIKVTFSEPIKAGTMWIELKTSSGTLIPITKSISGNVLTIDPVNLLANGTKYTLTLHTGSIKDNAGNSLAAWSISFSVGPAPTVKAVDPLNNAVNVPLNKTIKVTFSESIKAGVNYWIELKNSNGTVISITKSISGNILTVKPTISLSKGVKYTLILHSGCITDLAGNPLAVWSSSFTTTTV